MRIPAFENQPHLAGLAPSRFQVRWLLYAAASAASIAPTSIAQNVRLAGEVELVRLVDLAAQQLDLNIEYDPGELRSGVHVRLGAGVTDAELWELTNRLLASKGLTTIRMPGDLAISVVGLAKARTLARVELDDSWKSNSATHPGYVRVYLSTRHWPTERFKSVLSMVLSSGGSVEVAVENELLLISDLRPRVQQAAHLLELLDVPYKTAVEEVPLAHRSAAALTAKIAQIAEKSESVTGEWRRGQIVAQPDDGSILIIAPAGELDWWRSQIARFDRAEPRRRQTYSPLHHGVEEVAGLLSQAVVPTAPDSFAIITDQLTGSLIVTGTAEEHAQVAELIARLNETPASARRPVRTFTLRNRQAEEVLSVIEGLVAVGIFEAQTSIAGDQSTPPPSGDDRDEDGSPRDPQTPREPTDGRAPADTGMYLPDPNGFKPLGTGSGAIIGDLAAVSRPWLIPARWVSQCCRERPTAPESRHRGTQGPDQVETSPAQCSVEPILGWRQLAHWRGVVRPARTILSIRHPAALSATIPATTSTIPVPFQTLARSFSISTPTSATPAVPPPAQTG